MWTPIQTLTGISPTSYNATLYYETNRLERPRASLNHRSHYYTGRIISSAISASTRGFEGTTFVQTPRPSYNITPKLQLTFDAINLDEREGETQFWGQPHYLYNQTQSGTTYMVGASYKF